MSYDTAAALLRTGPSRPTLFSVSMPRIGAAVNDYLDFFCKATSIPSLSLETTSLNGQSNMGIVRQQPLAMIYGKPFTMTVIENTDFTVYKAMREWIDLTTQNANQAGAFGFGGRSHRQNYYDSYVSDFTLTKLEQPNYIDGINGGRPNDNYKKPVTVTFLNAYPVEISSMSLDSSSQNSQLEFDINFTYESYSVDGLGMDIFGIL